MKDLNFFAVESEDKDNCFWCGAIPETEDDYTPCKNCEKTINTGVMIIEMDEEPQFEGQPETDGGYPTGRWGMMPVDMARFLFPEKPFMDGTILPISQVMFQMIVDKM